MVDSGCSGGAQNGIRTRDLILTKDVLYRLSYLGRLGACGADDGTRTRNRRFTKPLLYQLSYVGAPRSLKQAWCSASDR